MLKPGQPVLLAVSGGGDSLALWDALLALGYPAAGIHLDLGLGEFSARSAELCEAFASNRQAELYILSLPRTFGVDIGKIIGHSRRPACSLCGALKRHLLNRAAYLTGHEVVATGHNMEDEASALLGNLLGWHRQYLARQYPHLPSAGKGLPSRIKPLVRVTREEVRYYCSLRGIQTVQVVCPLSEGATTTDYEVVLQTLEKTHPGLRPRFLFGFWETEQERFRLPSPPPLSPCVICGMLTGTEVCLYCRTLERAGLDPRAELLLEKRGSSGPGSYEGCG